MSLGLIDVLVLDVQTATSSVENLLAIDRH
jgi:hypothetical protein